MPVNLDLIKNKLNQLQKQSNKSNNLWKPSAGKQSIRIVPYKYDRENPFIELLFHYNLGNKNYLSPASFGNPDPICELADKLKNTGDQDDWKMGRKIEPKMRTYVPILVRGKEAEGVKFWGFGKTVYTELLSFIADPDYGDITDPQAGRDITVEFIPAAGANEYPKTQIRIKPNQSPVTQDPDVLAMIKEQPEITEVFAVSTYEELEAALQTWMSGTEETGTETSTEDVPENNKVTSQGSDNVVDDAAAAFDKLFN